MITGKLSPAVQMILTPDAIAFLSELERTFRDRRKELLQARIERQKHLDRGAQFTFLEETRAIRESVWKVAPCPKDLEDRRVEITGPAERKMMINALNSGARVFMADLEDALSPTWENTIEGQIALKEAVRRTLSFRSPDGKEYKLAEQTATLLVRPRGWHLSEAHFVIDGEPMSGSLFDFGLYFFHNAKERLERGTGPYFYIPKLESHKEARLWNEVFVWAQDKLGIPQGSIRATVLIETISAAFEMDEILFELKDHVSGLNAGRWDYLFSCIKKFRNDTSVVFPDRAQLTMTVPFMRAYTELLVQTCHKRGAHAMGGMAAFIPSRKDPEVNARALARVTEDKQRESRDGFDGTWVAHPDLVPVAQEAFDAVLGTRPNQKDRLREDVQVSAAALVNFDVPGGQVTEAGVRLNINVALQYIERWLQGFGAVAIHGLMEDAATAEISRAQLWQWYQRTVRLSEGKSLDRSLFDSFFRDELEKLGNPNSGHYRVAAELLDSLVKAPEFSEFLTLPAYEQLKKER